MPAKLNKTQLKNMFRGGGGGWRYGSAVKSTDCSSRGPEFNTQQPLGGSQPSVMGSDALFWCV
ncbi:chemokine-like factor, isoform CRA_c [Rattus norvegicus]|uniref:Chemokine-like factor, isoform CRA_c n=1 Tax=Rattus norvegicus TaxID=10116 RepID=A6JXW8_RAT|nr:chemokine-like factor, isoform CRA_c [Rattus norvegicus]